MESVVQNIVEGLVTLSSENCITVYANSHFSSFKKTIDTKLGVLSIKEITPFLFKSQPLNIIYSSLPKLLQDTDVVHHHYPFPNMELALLRNKKLLKQKKLIITWHANIQNSRWNFIEKYYSPLIKQLLDIAVRVVVTSPQLLEHSNILKDYKNKVSIIPLSFDPSISSLMVPRRFPEERRFKVLFVGKLREYKGIKYLIEAIQPLHVELKIIGDGENEDALKQLTRELGLEGKVTFAKGLSNDALRDAYEDSDLFVLPSINEAEAFGVVQLEAMSNALPVINTNLKSGVPYVSLDGITGFTVMPKSSEALKEAILKIISDKELYEKFSSNALLRVKEFSRDKLAESYLKLYNS